MANRKDFDRYICDMDYCSGCYWAFQNIDEIGKVFYYCCKHLNKKTCNTKLDRGRADETKLSQYRTEYLGNKKIGSGLWSRW